ncbi:hypothetical protein ASE00_05980 [Sphingomonas sp. Root710]|uniref:hypothetical protein n=1 Tax=Sphingomonas sp. Root710 TaxID=1736594 RepID=UPI0006F20FF0|nr:hypothetical protein [Sphingomonas sp. Root710]KRB86273.1 hypothetical protein ASE00_05980 [Sphingomonas sp. Root710]
MKPVILAVAMMVLPLQALGAHPRLSAAPGTIAQAVRFPQPAAYAGEPRARIRTSNREGGLSPLAFAEWLVRHQALFLAERALLRQVSNSNDLIDRSARSFSIADSNRDHRISAIELADFIAIDPAKALVSQIWVTKSSP